jgi:hypothetical protein
MSRSQEGVLDVAQEMFAWFERALGGATGVGDVDDARAGASVAVIVEAGIPAVSARAVLANAAPGFEKASRAKRGADGPVTAPPGHRQGGVGHDSTRGHS